MAQAERLILPSEELDPLELALANTSIDKLIERVKAGDLTLATFPLELEEGGIVLDAETETVPARGPSSLKGDRDA